MLDSRVTKSTIDPTISTLNPSITLKRKIIVMRATAKSNIDPQHFTCDNLVIPLYSDQKLSSLSRVVNEACSKLLTRVIENEDFKAKNGEASISAVLITSPKFSGVDQVSSDWTKETYRSRSP